MGRKFIRRLGWTLIGGACLVLLFLGYQLFVTDLLNDRIQSQAREELEQDLDDRRQALPDAEVVTVELADPEPVESPDPPTAYQVDYMPEKAGEEGSTLGRIAIPAIDIDEVMFAGVTRETLKMGPGHMPWTPVPGQPGNAVISGHRTTYGRPFYDLDQVEIGDQIEVETAVGRHVFEVREIHIVEPHDVWVTEEKPGAWLTLTTCHPHFSAAERLVIQAELVEGPNLGYAALLAGEDPGAEGAT